MFDFFSSITFVNPLALLALLALPVIWWLLRFTPPKPQTIAFPPTRILRELKSTQDTPDSTPWWLLLLRLALTASLILAVSQPIYAPGKLAKPKHNNIVLVIDNGWAAAKNWRNHEVALREILDDAQRNNQTVSLIGTAQSVTPPAIQPISASAALAITPTLAPRALPTNRSAILSAMQKVSNTEIIWLSDGIESADSSTFISGLQKLTQNNSVVVYLPAGIDLPLALGQTKIISGQINVEAHRPLQNTEQAIKFRALAANGRTLATADATFTVGKPTTSAKFDLPIELRNEIQSVEILGESHAGAKFLSDDRWRLKTVGLKSGGNSEASQTLLAPLHYVSRALEPYVELNTLQDTPVLKANLEAGLSMLVLADIGVLPAQDLSLIAPWIENGGVLLRFAGPRLASAQDLLMPTILRPGDRQLGSALSWENPQPLQPFPNATPFAGIAIDPTVSVQRQVLAEPDAVLAEKTWASLADGTPLITATTKGKGLIILFHVTANADWSNLPLSGMFVEMLQRIVDLAPNVGSGAAASKSADTTNASFIPLRQLSGSGELIPFASDIKPIQSSAFDRASASPETPPGLYGRGNFEAAINLNLTANDLKPIGALPTEFIIKTYTVIAKKSFAPLLFLTAMIIFLLDMISAIALKNGFSRFRPAALSLLLFALIVTPNAIQKSLAQSTDEFAMQATLETRLAYIKTGNSELDRISMQGLRGLSEKLDDRTSVTLGDPLGIDIKSDDLVFFPIIYWPIDENASEIDDETAAKMTGYMKNGGTFFFDLRENGTSVAELSGNSSASAQALNSMLSKLDIPSLEPANADHVISKSFYLLNEFPGRYRDGKLWLETSDTEQSANNSDGVSSIIIGANDYAAAWATDDNGEPLYAVIPGGDNQREMAIRTGINLVMYALTGNYKADQVHVPALLERLGQ
jgi:Domain of unknown function (DUF4159)/Aerotolerance regulator N-terminal